MSDSYVRWTVNAVINLLPTLILVWMIGFSEDGRRFRLVGFIIFAFSLIAPHLVSADILANRPTGMWRSGIDLVRRLVIDLTFGGYMIFWALRSGQAKPAEWRSSLEG